MIPNHYKTLGISQTAAKNEVKKAYRHLALKYHPDINRSPDAHDKFIAINEAYLILSDDDARVKYDYEYRLYFTRQESQTADDRNHSTDSETSFDDENLNQWTKNARHQAEGYARMAYSDFSKLVIGIVKETGFQLWNALILMIGITFMVSGIGNIVLGLSTNQTIGNPFFGVLMLPVGFFLNRLARGNQSQHNV